MSTNYEPTQDDAAEYQEWLDALRDEYPTPPSDYFYFLDNCYHSGERSLLRLQSALMTAFGLESGESRSVVISWVQTL